MSGSACDCRGSSVLQGRLNMKHIKEHYYRSHDTINPTGIVPAGPVLNLDGPHERERFKKSQAG